MKKVIAIVAVVAVALIGLTSYNGTEVKKNGSNGSLIAELKSGGTGVSQGTNTGTLDGGGKKKD